MSKKRAYDRDLFGWPHQYEHDRVGLIMAQGFRDAYSGHPISVDQDGLDVDHVIPLEWAWEHGADKWTRRRQHGFANDIANLAVTSAHLNRQKGAKGPDEWTPPNEADDTRYRIYVRRWRILCDMYGLPMPDLKD